MFDCHNIKQYYCFFCFVFYGEQEKKILLIQKFWLVVYIWSYMDFNEVRQWKRRFDFVNIWTFRLSSIKTIASKSISWLNVTVNILLYITDWDFKITF